MNLKLNRRREKARGSGVAPAAAGSSSLRLFRSFGVISRGAKGLFSITLLLGTTLAPGLCVGQSGTASSPQNTLPPARLEPKAQQLLDGLLQALGGPAFLHFKTMTTRGRAFSIQDEKTVGMAPYTSATEYPDKRRFSYGKKEPVILINNGDHAWELDRYGLTAQFPEQAYRWQVSNRYSLENLLRLRIHEPGMLIQAGGTDFVDNVPTQEIEITEPRGGRVRLDLNRQTLLPVRIIYRVQNPKTLEWDEFADTYGDYRSVQGIATPMHLARWLNGERVSETYRNEVRYDEDYPAGYFQPSN